MDFRHENIVINTNVGIRFWKSQTNINGYVPFHWHSSIEVVCVLHGQLTFSINGQHFKIRDNQFIIVPSGLVHDVSNTPNTAFVLQIPLPALKPYVMHPERTYFVNGRTDNPAYQQVIKLILRFGQLQATNPAGYRFDSQIVFVQLLKIFFTQLSDSKKQIVNDSSIKRIIIYINEHYREKLQAAQLARYFGYNPSYLSRLFKQQMGIDLTNYIYTVRLNQLHNDLLNSNDDISTLFQKNGLSNPRTTRQIFKKMFGCLPSDLRQH